MRKLIGDLKGQKFGRWLVLRKDIDRADKRGRHDFYICRCECGEERSVIKYGLLNGTLQSCGCLMRESVKNRDTKHGFARSRLYTIYNGMKNRCYNKNHTSYRIYGGRGIKVCEEWLKKPAAFFDWCLNNGYAHDLSLDRIDVNGDYSPSNCRFTSLKLQQRNRRDSRTVFFRGVEYNLREACELFDVNWNNARTYYTNHKGNREEMTKYFEAHAI